MLNFFTIELTLSGDFHILTSWQEPVDTNSFAHLFSIMQTVQYLQLMIQWAFWFHYYYYCVLFCFFKIMPTLLLRHILGLEKSTAACFQPPFARTVQAQHWSTPPPPKGKPSSLWRKTSWFLFLSEHSLSCTVRGDLMPGVFRVSHQQKSQLG